MLSFNNKKIEELTPKELSIQIFTLTNFFKSTNIEDKYISMSLFIAEQLENEYSTYQFNLKDFIHFINNPNFSIFEKNIMLEGYSQYLKINVEKNKNNEELMSYHYSLSNLIETKKIYLNYSQLTNHKHNNPNKINECLNLINTKIIELEKYQGKQKTPALQRIIEIALKDLYFCKEIDCLI
jgi:hypothetical protein